MNQVHKEQLEKVENALPNRGGLEVEIFGTEGIPEDAVRDHQQRVIQNFHQDAAAHQARTGNPHSGSKDGPLSKRPKLPPPGELKRQLREYVAKKNQAKGISDTAPSPGGAATVQVCLSLLGCQQVHIILKSKVPGRFLRSSHLLNITLSLSFPNILLLSRFLPDISFLDQLPLKCSFINLSLLLIFSNSSHLCRQRNALLKHQMFHHSKIRDG